MKTIKITASILIFSLLFTFISCGTFETPNDNSVDTEAVYEALEMGGYDSLDGGIHSDEYTVKQTAAKDAVPPEEASFTFLDKTYTGKYKGKISNMYNDAYYYRFDNGLFMIDQVTGELLGIMFDQSIKMSDSDNIDIREIADTVAKKYIDIDNYTVSEEKDVGTHYKYRKMINGYKTNEHLTVVIDNDGGIISFFTTALNSFDNTTKTESDRTKLDGTIESKLKSIYSENTSWKNYEIQDIVLVKLTDGSIGYIYNIKNHFEKEEDGRIISSKSLISLLIKQKTN